MKKVKFHKFRFENILPAYARVLGCFVFIYLTCGLLHSQTLKPLPIKPISPLTLKTIKLHPSFKVTEYEKEIDNLNPSAAKEFIEQFRNEKEKFVSKLSKYFYKQARKRRIKKEYRLKYSNNKIKKLYQKSIIINKISDTIKTFLKQHKNKDSVLVLMDVIKTPNGKAESEKVQEEIISLFNETSGKLAKIMDNPFCKSYFIKQSGLDFGFNTPENLMKWADFYKGEILSLSDYNGYLLKVILKLDAPKVSDLYCYNCTLYDTKYYDNIPYNYVAGIDISKWQKKTLTERNSFFKKAAVKELSRVLNTNPNLTTLGYIAFKDFKSWDFLTPKARKIYLKTLKNWKKLVAVLQHTEKQKLKLLAADKNIEKIKNRLSFLKGHNVNEIYSQLSKIYDNTSTEHKTLDILPPKSEIKPDDIVLSTNLSEKDLKLLAEKFKKYFELEIGTTKIGKWLLGKNTEPYKIKIAKISSLARYYSETKTITLSEYLLKNFMTFWGITVKDVLSNKNGVFKNLVVKTFVSNFIHELTHHLQGEWSDNNGIADLYSIEEEVQANVLETIYIKEKLEKDAVYESLMNFYKKRYWSFHFRFEDIEELENSVKDFIELFGKSRYTHLISYRDKFEKIFKAAKKELMRRYSLSKEENTDEIPNRTRKFSSFKIFATSSCISFIHEFKTKDLEKFLDTDVFAYYENHIDFMVKLMDFYNGNIK